MLCWSIKTHQRYATQRISAKEQLLNNTGQLKA